MPNSHTPKRSGEQAALFPDDLFYIADGDFLSSVGNIPRMVGEILYQHLEHGVDLQEAIDQHIDTLIELPAHEFRKLAHYCFVTCTFVAAFPPISGYKDVKPADRAAWVESIRSDRPDDALSVVAAGLRFLATGFIGSVERPTGLSEGDHGEG